MLCPVHLTQQLVELNTTNPGSSEREAAQMLGALLKDAGFSVDFYEYATGRTNLIASLKGEHTYRPICFTGHLDTVPLGRTEWSVDPFSGQISDGRLYGRGTSDMKAGLAAFISAAIDFAEQSTNSNGLTLVITAGEETGCDGAKYLQQLEDVLDEVGALVVGEPTSNYPVVGHKGAVWLDLSTSGVTGHGSMPHTGINAIYRAMNVVSTLQSMDFSQWSDELLGEPTLNVATINGGMNLNSIPDLVHIGVDIRTVPGMSHEGLKNQIVTELDPYLSNVSTILDLDPVANNPNDEWIERLFDICSGYLDKRPEPRAVRYFTDASILQPTYGGIPTAILGPGEPEMAHQTDEYCYVSRIEEARGMYRDIINDWQSVSL